MENYDPYGYGHLIDYDPYGFQGLIDYDPFSWCGMDGEIRRAVKEKDEEEEK